MAEQQTTFAVWNHECTLGQPCSSRTHVSNNSTLIPYSDMLQDDDDDDAELQADESEAEEDDDGDYCTLRIDLLENSDGDEAWRPAPKEGEDEAELADLKHTIKFLKNLESTFGKSPCQAPLGPLGPLSLLFKPLANNHITSRQFQDPGQPYRPHRQLPQRLCLDAQNAPKQP